MHPIELLASAIAQSEGFFAPQNDLPKSNMNPGDLRASPLPRKKDTHGFVQFNNATEGWMALVTQLMLYALRGYTIEQTITSWAPPSGPDGGNNTALYLSETIRRMNSKGAAVTPSTKLSDFFHFESIP
jgi:hypothetical protein